MPICGQRTLLYESILNLEITMDLNLINLLRIASYNCKPVCKRVDTVRSILDNCDIFFVTRESIVRRGKTFY